MRFHTTGDSGEDFGTIVITPERDDQFTISVDYLLRHCDDENETETVEWVAGHVAEALGVDLTVRGYVIGASRGA
jgi:hypothetical protein